MPEGPECLYAARYVCRICQNLIFHRVDKASFSKQPEVVWTNGEQFKVSAVARGKEVILKLEKQHDLEPKRTFIRFAFGMSGQFRLVAISNKEEGLPKHAVLRFWTVGDSKALCFVDQRRFGRWIQLDSQEFSKDRGPCPIQDYGSFRVHVLDAVRNCKGNQRSVFNGQLCDVLLNQQYFNGIGNYLRAEIMFRAKISPFQPAVTVLRLMLEREDSDPNQTVVCPNSSCEFCQLKREGNVEEPKEDFLSLCHTVPFEVVALGGYVYSKREVEDETAVARFQSWLRCYMQEGMRKKADKNKRTVWYSPQQHLDAKDDTSKKKSKRKKADDDKVVVGETKSNGSVASPKSSKAKTTRGRKAKQ